MEWVAPWERGCGFMLRRLRCAGKGEPVPTSSALWICAFSARRRKSNATHEVARRTRSLDQSRSVGAIPSGDDECGRGTRGRRPRM